MLAEQNLRRGDLAATLHSLQEQVRSSPADPKLRVFLFQLLAVLGQWERALKQLQIAGELDAGTLAMVQTYREALRCEALRTEVFAGRRSPLVFGDPEPWLAQLLEALRLTARGHHGAAELLRERAFEEAPAAPGVVDGVGFTWIADADPRLGPVLEAVVSGRYYWIPFVHIREINLEEPADLRDLVWTPARFLWANGGEAVGLIPTRYPGSETDADDRVRLARRTEWMEETAASVFGRGQRMLATDAGEHPLLELRSIRLDGVTGAPADAGGSGAAGG
ncbi:MAG: type VI secretion system accessory protein TagJ [Deferrisomatales bacterium]|nr:type VI secretion system accessory protein TagJ [Deferrisomatales bacterium]